MSEQTEVYKSRTYAELAKYDGSDKHEHCVLVCETLFEEYDKQFPGTDHWEGPKNEFQYGAVPHCSESLSLVNGDSEELINLAHDLMEYGF